MSHKRFTLIPFLRNFRRVLTTEDLEILDEMLNKAHLINKPYNAIFALRPYRHP